MKKQLFIFAAALALVGCSNSSYDGNQDPFQKVTDEDSAIVFTFAKSNNWMGAPMRRAGEIYGSEAATILGKRFIVEGTKGILPDDATTSTVVFDNYLVRFEANTAGTTESNTNNWEYVGITENNVTEESGLLANLGRTVDQQTIKYWDYSVPQYDFVAYSTGDAKMVSGTPSAGQVQVTKINGTAKSYSFTALNSTDLAKVYYTDVVTVVKDNYNKPVQLKFKSLTSKVRMAIYESVPGYAVRDVEFFADDATTTVTYNAASLPADQTALDAANATSQLYTESAGVYTAYTTYDAGVLNVYTAKSTTSNTATLFNTATALPTSGTIDVTYPVVGANFTTAAGYNKANVSVSVGSSDSNTQEFGTLASSNTFAATKDHNEPDGNYLGRTSSAPTFAGLLADNYYKAVMPNPAGQSLTLRVNYTLVSTDGSNETIKVWGAKAVVPATYTKWQPNYAYTYIFKISDKSNGSTEELDGIENLFPITFDAVVEDATDATAEQTTITTVATPSITTYQKGHVYTDASTTGEYLASKGTIYVMVKDENGDLAEDLDSNGQLYTVATTGAPISEAAVMDALLKTVSGSADVDGRNGIALTEATSTVGNSYVALDGKTVTLTESNCVASFTPAAGTYAYVYKVADATLTYEAYQPVAVVAGTTDVDNYKSIAWSTIAAAADLAASETADKDYLYFQVTKNNAGTETHYSYITVVPGVTVVAAGTGVKKIAKTALAAPAVGKAAASTFYFDVYSVNNAQYGVKVILVK